MIFDLLYSFHTLIVGCRGIDTSGKKVVLTAPETEMNQFKNNPFMAFSAAFPPTIPFFIVQKLLRSPPKSHPDGRAVFAPYGLRKLEATLISHGFKESEIVVVHPSKLDDFIGNETKAVGISSMDPFGIAYVSRTYSELLGFGSEPSTGIQFRKLLKKKCLKATKAKIIVGGAGSWQLENEKVRKMFGIDCIFLGEAEEMAPEVFSKAVNGENLPQVVHGEDREVETEEIPPIRHASIYGCVEISRGCNRNCQFCAPSARKRKSMPISRILEEVEVNVREGNRMIIFSTEDFFLYNSEENFIPNRKAVIELCRKVADCPGVKHIQPAHMSLAPVVVDPTMVNEVAEILLEKSWSTYDGKPFFTSETGVETGSKRLIKKYMAGKSLPFKPEDWPNIVTQAFGILNDSFGYPLATWMVGLPGENEGDVLASIELVEDLKGTKGFFVPLFFVPLGETVLRKAKGVDSKVLSELHWEFFAECWRYNFNVWRKPWELRGIRSLISKILVPMVGGFMYLSYYKHRPSAKFFKKALISASKVDFLTARR
jgi:radical SAM superfamily enzyme YgiQ (UPF0313 family)